MKFRIAKVRDGGRMDGLDDPRDDLTGKWRVNCIDCRRVLGYYDDYDTARLVVVDQFTCGQHRGLDGWTIADMHRFSSCWLSVASRAQWRDAAGQSTVVITPAQKLAGSEAVVVSKVRGRQADIGPYLEHVYRTSKRIASECAVPQQLWPFGR